MTPPASAPLVSCIVPVWNGERYLASALESVLAQTHRPLEIVVVDDGSTDGTEALLRGWTQRVRVLRQANAGAASARNAGMGAAQGEFFAFLDADDLWRPEKLARQIGYLREHPGVDVCVTHVAAFHEGAPVAVSARRPLASPATPAYVASTLFARRALFERVGPFDPALRHADVTEWLLRLRSRSIAIGSLAEALVERRLHPGNTSLIQGADSISEHLRVVKASLDLKRR